MTAVGLIIAGYWIASAIEKLAEAIESTRAQPTNNETRG